MMPGQRPLTTTPNRIVTTARTKRADLQQICNRSVLTKTDQLQTNLSSAESVFSLLQTVSLITLGDSETADENRLKTDLQIICSVCR